MPRGPLGGEGDPREKGGYRSSGAQGELQGANRRREVAQLNTECRWASQRKNLEEGATHRQTQTHRYTHKDTHRYTQTHTHTEAFFRCSHKPAVPMPNPPVHLPCGCTITFASVAPPPPSNPGRVRDRSSWVGDELA